VDNIALFTVETRIYRIIIGLYPKQHGVHTYLRFINRMATRLVK